MAREAVGANVSSRRPVPGNVGITASAGTAAVILEVDTSAVTSYSVLRGLVDQLLKHYEGRLTA